MRRVPGPRRFCAPFRDEFDQLRPMRFRRIRHHAAGRWKPSQKSQVSRPVLQVVADRGTQPALVESGPDARDGKQVWRHHGRDFDQINLAQGGEAEVGFGQGGRDRFQIPVGEFGVQPQFRQGDPDRLALAQLRWVENKPSPPTPLPMGEGRFRMV